MKHCYLFLVALLFVSTGYGQENILLEEYMPKSIYKIPETKVEKSEIIRLSMHTLTITLLHSKRLLSG